MLLNLENLKQKQVSWQDFLDLKYVKLAFSSAWKRIYKLLQKLMELFFFLNSEKVANTTDTDDKKERGHRGK